MDLIGRLGRQGPQPLGFGALAGMTGPSPTLALIGRARIEDLSSSLIDTVDAVILDGVDVKSISDAVDGLIWGAGPGPLSDDEVAALASAGCDFFIIDLDSAPAAIANLQDSAVIVSLSERTDRETAEALRAVGVDGSLNPRPKGACEVIFKDLVDIRRTAASTGGAALVEVSQSLPVTGLTALRDSGVDGIVVSLSDPKLVSDCAQKIRDLPPRTPRRSKGWQALSPEADR